MIADKTLVVRDDQLGINRQIVAGQPVPADLLDAYKRAVQAVQGKTQRVPARDKAHRAPDTDK